MTPSRGPAQLANGQPRPVLSACHSSVSVHVAHISLKMSLHYVETSEEESCLVIARFIGDVLDGEKVSRQHKTLPQHNHRASIVLQKRAAKVLNCSLQTVDVLQQPTPYICMHFSADLGYFGLCHPGCSQGVLCLGLNQIYCPT